MHLWPQHCTTLDCVSVNLHRPLQHISSTTPLWQCTTLHSPGSYEPSQPTPHPSRKGISGSARHCTTLDSVDLHRLHNASLAAHGSAHSVRTHRVHDAASLAAHGGAQPWTLWPPSPPLPQSQKVSQPQRETPTVASGQVYGAMREEEERARDHEGMFILGRYIKRDYS